MRCWPYAVAANVPARCVSPVRNSTSPSAYALNERAAVISAGSNSARSRRAPTGAASGGHQFEGDGSARSASSRRRAMSGRPLCSSSQARNHGDGRAPGGNSPARPVAQAVASARATACWPTAWRARCLSRPMEENTAKSGSSTNTMYGRARSSRIIHTRPAPVMATVMAYIHRVAFDGAIADSAACSMLPPSSGRTGMRLSSPMTGPAQNAAACNGVSSPWVGMTERPPMAT